MWANKTTHPNRYWWSLCEWTARRVMHRRCAAQLWWWNSLRMIDYLRVILVPGAGASVVILHSYTLEPQHRNDTHTRVCKNPRISSLNSRRNKFRIHLPGRVIFSAANQKHFTILIHSPSHIATTFFLCQLKCNIDTIVHIS